MRPDLPEVLVIKEGTTAEELGAYLQGGPMPEGAPLPMKTVEDEETGKTQLKPDNDWGCIFCTSFVCGNCYSQHTEEKHPEKYT